MRKTLLLSMVVFVLLSAFVIGCSKQSGEKPETATATTSSAPEASTPEPSASKKPSTEAVKPEVKPEVKPAAETPKPEVRPAKPADKPAPKPEVKPAAKPKPAGTPRLIELGGENCIPCKMMKPVLDGLKSEYSGKLKVEVYDVQKDEEIAKKYPVRVIPTQIFFDANGKELERHFGFISKEDILATFEKHGINLEKE